MIFAEVMLFTDNQKIACSSQRLDDISAHPNPPPEPKPYLNQRLERMKVQQEYSLFGTEASYLSSTLYTTTATLTMLSSRALARAERVQPLGYIGT